MDLRPYQSKCLDILITTTEDGRTVIPTAGGKTLIEALYLNRQLSFSGSKVHLILAPRIALLNQLIKDYRDAAGQGYVALAFHSGGAEPDYFKVKWQEFSTTSLEKVNEEIERAKALNKDLVIFSTVHSFHKLIDLNFDTVIADESQYLVGEQYFNTWQELNAKRKLCFTATERHTTTQNGRGLNNESVFGKVLFQSFPKELIDGGWIVPPKLHVMYASSDDSIKTTLDEVINLAKYQNQVTRESMPASKILFAMKGTDQVKSVIEGVKVIKAAMPNHKIFTIVSNAKYGSMVDGIKTPRGNFMKELRECDNALIFHYDILSEGIDIDGITGVAILRNMVKSKLIQTIGRAVRLFKANPAAKKFALVSVPVVNGNDETKAWVGDIVSQIRNAGFEINIEDINYTGEDGPGIEDDDGLDDAYDFNKNKRAAAQKMLEDIIHDLEAGTYWEKIDACKSRADKIKMLFEEVDV
jgi:superfamily II DNA or RNA helicase